MSTVPSAEPTDARQAAPVPPASGHLGGGEAVVVITAIAAVTVLAVLERPIPAVLTALAAAACLMLLPGRTGRMLRGWLRAAKGKLTFDSLARRAGKRGMAVSACTLRRALDGRLPTERTVVAFARGAGSDEDTARQVWAAAAAAVRAQPNRPRFPQVPGRITTGAGLVRAMRRVREAAGSPSLRRLVAAPQAEGLLRRSTLHLALTGRRLPSEQLLTAFAAACSAGEETADALVAARRRILAGPRPLPAYPCEAVEEAEDRRLRDAAARPWLADEDEEELDWYERHLVDEEDAEYRRLAAWVDDLTAEELNELQQPTGELNAGREAEPR